MSDHTADLTAVVVGCEGIRVNRGGGSDGRTGRPAPPGVPIGNA
jgi:hypothetical protein